MRDYEELNKKNFGLRLALLRKECNLTQKDLALMMDCKQSEIGKWETGKRLPRDETIIRLAEVMDKENPRETSQWLKLGFDPIYTIQETELTRKVMIEVDKKAYVSLRDEKWLNQVNELSATNRCIVSEIALALWLEEHPTTEESFIKYRQAKQTIKILNKHAIKDIQKRFPDLDEKANGDYESILEEYYVRLLKETDLDKKQTERVLYALRRVNKKRGENKK